MSQDNFSKLLLKDLDLSGKRVMIRLDLNAKLLPDGSVGDNSRIVAALPSIRYSLEQGASVILISHLGRPNHPDPNLSLKPIAQELENLLKTEVKLAPSCVGPEVKKLVDELMPREILLLENIRFHEAECNPSKDPEFANELASYADVYINDAFGAAHREHSSCFQVPKLFRDKGLAAAGFLIEKELHYLGQTLSDPKHPFIAIIGGAKISTKVGVLESLLNKVDGLVLVGAMAMTFLKALRKKVGSSVIELEALETAKQILETAKAKKVPILLPRDVVCAHSAYAEESEIIDLDDKIPEDLGAYDIGPQTIEAIERFLKDANTIFWNGPAGVFENPIFAEGTEAIAKIIGRLNATSIAGGGDSVAAIKQVKLDGAFTHLSTGGGASLEFIEKGSLPGIEVLSPRNKIVGVK